MGSFVFMRFDTHQPAKRSNARKSPVSAKVTEPDMEIGGYHIDGKLGEGAMGEVWVGTHPLMGKRVAIKVLREEHSANADVVNRFFREARATQLLNHPGCVDIIDTGRLDDGRGYIVMALLEGESLKDRLERTPLPPATQIAIARQIADVLGAAHDKGIVHRDLKPENIFLVANETDPSGVRIKVLDFGVAKLNETGGQKLTNPNALIGTPAYMAPEQCKGAAFVDGQSDIYALGCILFEMACGRPPFSGKGLGDYIMAHLTQPPPTPSTLASIDPRLERVILRALAKEKPARQATMGELMGELDAIRLVPASAMAETIRNFDASQIPLPKRPRPPSAPNAPAPGVPWAWLALGIVLAGSILGGAVWFLFLRSQR
jgi:serine/threonine protein kinase